MVFQSVGILSGFIVSHIPLYDNELEQNFGYRLINLVGLNANSVI